MDWATFTLQFPPNINPAVEAEMKAGCGFQNWSVRGVERAYRKKWLGRIVDRYRGTRTKILILSLPYRPFPIPLSWPVDSGSFIVQAAKNPGVTIADEYLFTDLQRPDYFFDVFHVNRKGRELFSHRLAALIEQAGARNGP
jgi:lysophospholipase L1-like esterase